MSPGAVAEWDAEQRALWRLAADDDERDLRRPFHPDLSPVGWHIGHTAVAESYWIREALLRQPIPERWKAQYFAERSAKRARARRLPPAATLLAWAHALHEENLALLRGRVPDTDHPLLKEDFLPRFLAQHSAQHREIVQQVRHQRRLARARASALARACTGCAPRLPDRGVAGAIAMIGADAAPGAYDNERPAHACPLQPYAIASQPVSNEEYLGFIEAGGYTDARYWSEAGWRWRRENGCAAPLGWRQDARGRWYVIEPEGANALAPAQAVSGISYYEAQAFARYAGCRLPTEHEWEHALRIGVVRSASVATWEWCANRFYPYPGFRAFPYEGYSTPWFDGRHIVLRGASRYTAACVRRISFRNFHTPEKRHVFAGLRLARDDAKVVVTS